VDRLSALTDRFLLPAGQSRTTAFNLHTVLERVRLLLVAEGVNVERDYDPSLPECAGDVDRLVQGVLNLARNAVESGSSRVLLRTRFERAAELATLRADALRLDVVDDGKGIPDRLRSTLFLPLVSGRDGGTGLGLATAHEIIVEHGGRIAFESRPGHTVFTVWLPLADTDA
jgi:two-component system nitrogen regulation sensor histidine kinase GlnL